MPRPDPFAVERAATEEELSRKLGRALTLQERAIIEVLDWPPDIANLTEEFMGRLGAQTLGFLGPILQTHAVAAAGIVSDAAPIHISDRIFIPRLEAWAQQHAYELSNWLNTNTQQTVAASLTKFMETPGLDRAAFEQMLNDSGLFTPARASLIAVTETTRASSQATKEIADVLDESGFKMDEIWNTSHDDIVCDICRPLDGGVKGTDWNDPPPDGSHPGCRCTTSLEWVADWVSR